MSGIKSIRIPEMNSEELTVAWDLFVSGTAIIQM